MTHYSAVTEEVVEDLKSLVGPHNVAVEPEKLASYSRDEVALQFWDREYRAEVLVLPESTDHVSAVPVSYTHLDVYKRQDGGR